MLQLRSASRACLRAFLLASAVMLSGITSAHASNTVTLNFNNPGVTPSHSVLTNTNGVQTAGQFNWTWQGQSGGTPLGTTNSAVATFCIELTQTISPGSTYTYRIEANIATLPLPGGGMGAQKATQLQALANAYKTGALTSILSPVASIQQAVIQAAIWETVKETPSNALSGTTGDFRIQSNSSPLDPVKAAFDTALANVLGLLNTSSFITANTGANQQWFALGLTSDGGVPGNQQDQIVFVTASEFGGNGGVIVPVPAGLVMAGMGVVCLGGFNFLRRRKTIAVA